MATKKKKMLGAQMKTDSSAQASWIKDTGHKAPKGTYHYTGGQTREVAGRLAEKTTHPQAKMPAATIAKHTADYNSTKRGDNKVQHGATFKNTSRRDKRTDNEWSNHSKSMRSAGGTSNTRDVRSAIKNTARSFATPMRTPSVARSGYVKKAYSNRTLQNQNGVSNRVKTAVDKRDYAVPESSVGLRTKARTISKKKWGR